MTKDERLAALSTWIITFGGDWATTQQIQDAGLSKFANYMAQFDWVFFELGYTTFGTSMPQLCIPTAAHQMALEILSAPHPELVHPEDVWGRPMLPFPSEEVPDVPER